MATAVATAAPALSWYQQLAQAATGMGVKVFESIGEGSTQLVQAKVNEKLGLMPSDSQYYYDVTGTPAYQRQQQTSLGRDWDGTPLNEEVISVGGLSVTKSTATTFAWVAGALVAGLFAYKLIK
jgi:hypothetical protein